MNNLSRNEVLKVLSSVIFLTVSNFEVVAFQNFEGPIKFDSKNVATEFLSCQPGMSSYQARKGDEIINICECRDTYLYFSWNDTCHEAYKLGPCQLGEYFVLPEGEIVAKCVKNPCLEDGVVPYNGSCYQLGMTGGPCGPKRSLEVKNGTFKLGCSIPFGRSYSVIDVPELDCPPGSRRNALEICRTIA